jgi:hypothetical protein
LILFWSVIGFAQDITPDEAMGSTGEPPGVGELTLEPEGVSTLLDLGLGFSQLGADSFIDTNIAFNLNWDKLELGFLVPLRIRIIDNEPEDDSVFREEDWDEPAEYLRIIRYVQYGSRFDPYYVRAGELSGVMMGHGTIVQGYNNVIDVNHYQWGLTGAVNLNFGGFELLMDNVTDPDVIGLRSYVRPWNFDDSENIWDNMAFGLTVVSDIDAPDELAIRTDGTYDLFDGNGNLTSANTRSTTVLGLDVELQVLTTELVSITPYADINMHFGQGSGFHLGNLANFSIADVVDINTRLEFRGLGSNYLPAYFDGLYELERYLFRPVPSLGLAQRFPKLQWLDQEETDGALEARVGWYGDWTLGLLGMVFLNIAYENYQGSNNSSLMARLTLPQAGPVALGAYFINQNFDGITDVTNLDNAMFVSEARASIYGPLYVIGQYSRRFSAQEDGSYETIDDWGVGVGTRFSF